MIFEIGRPGAPRIYLTTDDPASALLQCQDGELAVEVDVVPLDLPEPDHRDTRNALLSASDWTQMLDAPLSEPQRSAWAQYRQELRDIDLTSPDWPLPPGT